MHNFKINILFLNFDFFYMFRTRGFTFRKMAVRTEMV